VVPDQPEPPVQLVRRMRPAASVSNWMRHHCVYEETPPPVWVIWPGVYRSSSSLKGVEFTCCAAVSYVRSRPPSLRMYVDVGTPHARTRSSACA
jgi:hypothetical protein